MRTFSKIFTASGLNVTGAAHFGGAVSFDTKITGLAIAAGAVTARVIGTGSNSLIFSKTFDAAPWSSATTNAASGTVVRGWQSGFGHNAIIRGWSAGLVTSVTKGGSFGFKFHVLIPGAGITLTAKSVGATPVGTVGIRALTKMGLSITVAARSLVKLSAYKGGGQSAPGMVQPVIYYSYGF